MISDYRGILTNEGIQYPNRMVDKESLFICPVTGIAQRGHVQYQGKGDAWSYSLVPRQNTAGTLSESFICARPQRMVFGDRDGYTLDMRKGDKILASASDAGYDDGEWGKGFMYSCGVTHLASLIPEDYPLYRDKLRLLIDTDSIIGAPVIPHGGSASERASFILGYLSGAGWPNRLQSFSSVFMDFFIENAGLAGLVITGKKLEHLVNDYETNRILVYWSITYGKGTDTKYFRVVSGPVKYDYQVDLFSVYLENTGLYVLEGGWTAGSD